MQKSVTNQTQLFNLATSSARATIFTFFFGKVEEDFLILFGVSAIPEPLKKKSWRSFFCRESSIIFQFFLKVENVCRSISTDIPYIWQFFNQRFTSRWFKPAKVNQEFLKLQVGGETVDPSALRWCEFFMGILKGEVFTQGVGESRILLRQLGGNPSCNLFPQFLDLFP